MVRDTDQHSPGRAEFMPDQFSDYLIWAAREQGEALTNLKLQKLLYYAQAWYLALYNRPLFDEDFEAWVHGPVLASQYFRFCGYVWKPITEEVLAPQLPERVKQHLDEIIETFGSETAIALERMTHAEQPWLEARGDLEPHESSTNRIRKESMQAFYRAMQPA